MFDRRLGRGPSFGSPDTLRYHPNETHARASSTFAVAAQRIAHEQGCLGRRAKRVESHVKDRGIRFLNPDAVAIDQSCKERSQTGTLTHRFQIAVKIRHDAESIPLP